jgi:serine/threonine protein kinase
MAIDKPIQPNAEPIPGYRLLERIGRGGYGEVWKAEAPGGIHKAIKLVFGDMHGIGADGQAAEQEYRSLNRIKTIRHPFILSIERFEVIDGRLMIVMELADRNLWDRFNECVLQGYPGIPREELLDYMEEAAEALDLMNIHHQIQHLDIKPQNLFLVHNHIKVADFGLAKDLEGAQAAVTGGVTPTYASPEAFDGWVSRQSDQYSLAIVYQEMMTGIRPFNGSSTRQLIMQHLTAVPDVSSLIVSDRDPVLRALSKTPSDRYPNCMEFIRALRGMGSGTAPIPPNKKSSLDPALEPTKRPADTDLRTTSPDTRPTGKKLPALVTPNTLRSNGNSFVTQFRNNANETKIQMQLPATPIERTGNGVLVPTLFVGLGSLGLTTLQKMRQIIRNRFGRVTLPHLRWLYIDTDPQAIEGAIYDRECPFMADEVLLTRLQRPGHYMMHDALPAVDSWISPDVLYGMPRTTSTAGVRAIGRLALCDHYHSICVRLRSSFEPFLKSESLRESERLTGLTLRNNFPRVYIATSLGGGTGSGMLIDFAYLVRHELKELGFDPNQVTAMLGMPVVGSSDSANSPAMSNARAALSELQYFNQPETHYEFKFDTREAAIRDSDRPFRRCELFSQSNNDNKSPAEMAAHVAYAETLTNIGRNAHPDSAPQPHSPFSLVGVSRLVWPRRDLLKEASRQLSLHILKGWVDKTFTGRTEVPSASVSIQWRHLHLNGEDVGNMIDEALTKSFGSAIPAKIDEILLPITMPTGIVANDNKMICNAFADLLMLLGKPASQEHDDLGRAGTEINEYVHRVIQIYDPKLAAMVVDMVEQPGLRLAAADEAIRVLDEQLHDAAVKVERTLAASYDEVLQLASEICPIVAALAGEPARAKRAPSSLHSILRHWANRRFRCLILRGIAHLYRGLQSNIPEYIREVNLCRSQLLGFIRELEELTPKPAIDGQTRFLLPDPHQNLVDAASDMLSNYEDTEIDSLEVSLQDRIRQEFRALISICLKPRESTTQFLPVVLDHIGRFLETGFPQPKTAESLIAYSGLGKKLNEQIDKLVSHAAPPALSTSHTFPATVTVFATPEGAGAEKLSERARVSAGSSAYIFCQAVEEILVYREARSININALFAQDQSSSPVTKIGLTSQPTSAHSRKDIAWPTVGIS